MLNQTQAVHAKQKDLLFKLVCLNLHYRQGFFTVDLGATGLGCMVAEHMLKEILVRAGFSALSKSNISFTYNADNTKIHVNLDHRMIDTSFQTVIDFYKNNVDNITVREAETELLCLFLDLSILLGRSAARVPIFSSLTQEEFKEILQSEFNKHTNVYPVNVVGDPSTQEYVIMIYRQPSIIRKSSNIVIP